MFDQRKVCAYCAFVVLAFLLTNLIANRQVKRATGPSAEIRLQPKAASVPTSSTTVLSEAKEETRLRVEASYGNLPLSFEPNRGQTDPRVKFISRAGHRTLWLTQDEAVLALGRSSRSRASKAAAGGKEDRNAPAVLRMRFLSANPGATIVGEDQQAGTVNYFIGKPEQWRTKIPTYARVRYRSVYPGVDLVFYGNNRQMEYDLVMSPGVDTAQIRLGVSGANSLRLDADGNLVMKTAAGDVVQQKPRVYQRKGSRLIAVAGDYLINGKNEVGFRLGNYDHTAAVIIDPVLRYSSFLSGSGDENDAGTGIAIDSSNRAVVAGWTESGTFPGENGPVPPFGLGGPTAFVTKLDFTGSKVIFTAFLVNVIEFDTVALALDAADNIYMAGTTNGTNFDPAGFTTTPGAFQRNFGGGESDAWVAKFDSTGSKLIYSTMLGGSGDDVATSIDVDSAGNAYVTGLTRSKNFPVTSGVFQSECKLKNDGSCTSAFVTKLNALGTKALYSSYLGGHGTQSGHSIAVNPSGNAFVTGQTEAKDFPTTAGTMQPVPASSADAFVVQFSSSGSHLNFSTFLGGASVDTGNGIAIDSGGNVFVTGQTQSANFPIKNAFQPHCTGGCSFAAKLSPSLRLLYSTFIGEGAGTAIAATTGGEAYVAGIAGINFPTTQNAFQRVRLNNDSDGETTGNSGFITKLTPTGQLSYSSRYGAALLSNSLARSPRMALDRDANAYLTGIVGFQPFTSIPVTPGAFQEQPGAELDGFVAKVVSLCALSTTNRTVTICSPGNGSTVKSPVRIIAGTTDVTPVRLTQIYLDGKKIFEQPLSAINVALPIAGGTHRLTVQGLDMARVFFKKSISINVSPH
jgi:hypothetical protein